jgi:hypothetical protein
MLTYKRPIRILLDTGIFSHSEIAIPAVKQEARRWGTRELTFAIQGFRRKAGCRADYQAEIDALFTIGRLIGERSIEAFEYVEISFERLRARTAGWGSICNALRGCEIKACAPAVERSAIVSTINFVDAMSKGGKKDRARGVPLGSANQISCFKWLLALKKEHIEAIRQNNSKVLHFTDFDLESLSQIEWFQFLCQRCGSEENFPDVFHLWTAERNNMDVFLTLEKRFPNFIAGVKKEKDRRIEIRTEVLRPLGLLEKLGIEKLDPVPMEPGRFYYFHELLK